VSHPSSDPVGWLLRSAENDDAVPRPARFRRWVACGVRDDYAEVEFIPPLDPIENGVLEALTLAMLAPRHEGVTLRALTDFPAHVYVTTVPPELIGAASVPPEMVRIRMWGVLVGAL
jgi:hypothetical protein